MTQQIYRIEQRECVDRVYKILANSPIEALALFERGAADLHSEEHVETVENPRVYDERGENVTESAEEFYDVEFLEPGRADA